MEDSVLEAEVKRLKNLKNYKDMTEDQFIRVAKVNLHVRAFKSLNMFDDSSDEGKKEQQLAEERFKSYLMNNELESDSELDTLRSLVYNEVFEVRLQKELNKLAKEQKYPPDRLTKQLTDIQTQKLDLKLRLGLDSEKKEESELSGLQILMKKFDRHANAHRNEFTITCPHGTLLLVRKKVLDFDVMPHPWFAGRWFFNYPLFSKVKEGKISKEDAWEIMCGASQGADYKPAFSKKYCTDYIDYCLEHWAEITESLEKK